MSVYEIALVLVCLKGEDGQNAMKCCGSVDDAIKDFKKKFKDKTKNDWDNRSNFKPAAGKYTLLEMDDNADQADTAEKVHFHSSFLYVLWNSIAFFSMSVIVKKLLLLLVNVIRTEIRLFQKKKEGPEGAWNK